MTATTVNAGAGNQQVTVSPTAESLDTIAGPLTVKGGGHTQLIIDDQKANETGVIPVLTTDVLTGTTLTRSAAGILLPFGPGSVDRVATITYGGLAGLTLNAGATHNVITVEATSTATTVNAGAGNAVVTVSPTAESLGTIASPLTVHGGGATQLVLDDQKNLASKTYTITSGTFQSTGAASITDSGLSSLSVNGSEGADTYIIGGTGTGVATTINGGVGNNTLVGPNVASTWNITAVNGGTVGNVTFRAVENLTGGTGMDAFVFGAGTWVNGKVDGGGGGDWLDYSAYTLPVTVNLAAGTATGIVGGIARIQNVRGGQGGNNLTGNSQGNILIGGAGSNTIVGGSGRSLLIGGKGTGYGHGQLRQRHPDRRLHELRLEQPRQ